MTQSNITISSNYKQLFIKYFFWIFFIHAMIFLLVIYGIPDFNFKKRPDLTIELSVLSPSSGGQQKTVVQSRPVPQSDNHKKNLPKNKEGSQQIANTSELNATTNSSASGPANAQTVDADYKATYLNNPKPPYPPLAIRMGLEGKVTLLAEVMPDGKAGRVAIETSSGHQMLDQSALQTVKHWQFSPARKDGVIISQVVRIPITFNLKSR